MQRINRSSLENSLDKPYAPMAIDIQIGLQRGSTAALEMTPERLQATKQMKLPSIAQRIEELIKKMRDAENDWCDAQGEFAKY
ncbi:hypothetical protein BCON_0584g00020 [Botryotinia convoluta]|uniref:Uncharacterized protein n=1 Tax=Botryotinia convoluta TaxID=54673 RepID=A0A4Z1HG97_9HELO|nr:hypothetical protein BCON_0584g00020 [Botryotinia convoluta]